jgi:hypothetical protein
MRNTVKALMVLGMVLYSAATAPAAEWVSLFDGKTLAGWSVHSGFAEYRAEDGAIVGTTVTGSPNSFLCTDKEYTDFILEFEVMVDPKLNSGVQFRSTIAPDETVFIFLGKDGQPQTKKIPKDRVYGYQAEIATETLGTSGGVYDEARRGFMIDDIRNDPVSSKAFKDGQWNKYRIECNGNSIKTTINGIPCADFKDDLTSRGIIGLQVHSVGKNPNRFEVKWRQIRIKELNR